MNWRNKRLVELLRDLKEVLGEETEQDKRAQAFLNKFTDQLGSLYRMNFRRVPTERVRKPKAFHDLPLVEKEARLKAAENMYSGPMGEHARDAAIAEALGLEPDEYPSVAVELEDERKVMDENTRNLMLRRNIKSWPVTVPDRSADEWHQLLGRGNQACRAEADLVLHALRVPSIDYARMKLAERIDLILTIQRLLKVTRV